MKMTRMDGEWVDTCEVAAGNIDNDPDLTTTFVTDVEIVTQGVDEVRVMIDSYTLDTETALRVYPQFSDDGSKWTYPHYQAGTPWYFEVNASTKVDAEFLVPFVRGPLMRLRIGSEGTAGNGAIKCATMRQQDRDVTDGLS